MATNTASTNASADVAADPAAGAAGDDDVVEAWHVSLEKFRQKLLSKIRTSNDTETICMVLFCIFLPPLAVFVRKGCGCEVWISVLLTLLFWIPGLLYAFYIYVCDEPPN